MKHLMGWWAISALIFCLTACDGKPVPNAKSLPAKSSPLAGQNPNADLELKLSVLAPHDQSKIVTNTPDNSVKSWWEAFDQYVKAAQMVCVINQNGFSRWKADNLGSLVTAEALKRFIGAEDCDAETWKRQIDEVKSESETRAVVFATVWSDRKPDGEARSEDVALAKSGTKIKYVLEKSAGTWIISDILLFRPQTTYSKESWEQMYSDAKSNPVFQGTVYHQ